MQSVDKKYFLLNKGINTEAPLVAWPEGFTIDEQNFDLLQDGSRRRRKGLGIESGTPSPTFPLASSLTDMTNGTNTYRWKNVNNDDSISFNIIQVGAILYFWNDPKTGPLGAYTKFVDLSDMAVRYTDDVTGESFYPSTTQLAQMHVTMTEVNGKLVAVGKYIEPTLISYKDGELTAGKIIVKERDLFGVDDGVDMDVTPAVLSDEHEYNLFSRGWTADDIETFHTETNPQVYPSKNMIHFMGMRRQTETGFAEDDGIKVFSPDKLMAEFFQNMSAPQGHITREVFNRRTGYGSLGQAEVVKTIASAVSSPASGVVTITSQDAAHGVNAGERIEVSGISFTFRSPAGNKKKVSIDGEYLVSTVVDADTFTIVIPASVIKTTWSYLSTDTLGQYTINGLIQAPFAGFEPSDTRFTQVASFAGRIFYGGCPDSRLSDRLYFTKVIESDKDFAQCYQEADPTSEFISDLLPTDGGYITIPDLGTLRALFPYANALLCFSTEGVWAITPGEGVFSAISYGVRKLTDAECLSSRSVVVADNTPFYWSSSGIYAIVQDTNSGFLSAQNLTKATINTFYNNILHDEKVKAKVGYDPVRKRIFWLYNNKLTEQPTGDAPRTVTTSMRMTTSVTPQGTIQLVTSPSSVYNAALIFDLNFGAWIPWTFRNTSYAIREVISLPINYTTPNENGSVRFLVQVPNSYTHAIAEINDALYQDFGVDSDAYIYTGPDSLGEPERIRHAPYVHVFMRRIPGNQYVTSQTPVSGVEAEENSFVDLWVDNLPQSVFMQPRWDWARGTDSGKIGNYVQVYRETKVNDNEFGLVVTKNKVLGRGRNLFLCFKAGDGAPAWIDGWTIKYDANVRI